MENIGLIYKKRETFTGIGQSSGSLSPLRRRRILKNVAGIHISLILIPLIWYGIKYFFITPPPSVIKVTLLSSPPPDSSSPDVAVYTPPRKENSSNKPIEKPKVIKKVTKPKWQAKSSNEIKISKKVIKNKNSKPIKKISANDIAKKIRNEMGEHQESVKNSANGNISQTYKAKLYTAIYELWNQPNKSELGGKYPIVDITLTIESNGRISNSSISNKTGINAMDLSVQKLLESLKTLPKPPSGRITFTFSLEIVD